MHGLLLNLPHLCSDLLGLSYLSAPLLPSEELGIVIKVADYWFASGFVGFPALSPALHVLGRGRLPPVELHVRARDY